MTEVLLDCSLCSRQYTEADILRLRFFPATGVCYKCYRKMQKQSFAISCFGKKSNGKELGFDPLAVECREYCPDRELCPLFVTGKIPRAKIHIQQMGAVVNTKQLVTISKQNPYRANSNLNRLFKLCMMGITKDKLKYWCNRRGANYYTLTFILRKEKHKNGARWKYIDDGKKIRIEYPI